MQSQLARVRKKQHFSQSLPRGELRTVLRLALAHTVTEICTTSFVNLVILMPSVIIRNTCFRHHNCAKRLW